MLTYRSISLLLFTCLFAKSSDHGFFKNRYAEYRFHYGFLWPHHTSIEYSVNGHIPAFELNYVKQTDGNTPWDSIFRFPRMGLGTSYFYLQDHDIYGNAYGLYGFYEIPVFRYKKFKSSYRVYGGLSWLNNIWNIEKNPLQTAIGSHINLYFRADLSCYFAIKNKTEATLGLGLTHFSNGNIKEPNLGLNIVTLTGGLLYNLNYDANKKIIAAPAPSLKKVNFNIFYYAGYRGIGIKNDFYLKNSLTLHAGYNFNHKRQVGGGFDLLYDGTRKAYPRPGAEKSKSDLFQAGLVIYHDLRYNKLILTVQAGYYIFNRHDYRAIYNRYGLKYFLNDKMCASVCLKAHKTQADYVEWGIGFIL